MMCYYLNVHFQGQRGKSDILNEQYKLYDLQMAVKHSNFRDIAVHGSHSTINVII